MRMYYPITEFLSMSRKPAHRFQAPNPDEDYHNARNNGNIVQYTVIPGLNANPDDEENRPCDDGDIMHGFCVHGRDHTA